MCRSQQLSVCRRTLHTLRNVSLQSTTTFNNHSNISNARAATLVCPYFYSHTSVHTTSTPRRNSHFIVCPNAYQHTLTRRPQRIRRHLTGNSQRSLHVTVPITNSTHTTIAIRSHIFKGYQFSLPHSLNSAIIQQTSNLFTCRLIIAISSLLVNISSVIHKHSLLQSTTLRLCVHRHLLSTNFKSDSSNNITTTRHSVHFTRLPLVSGTTKQQLTGHRQSLSVKALHGRNIATRQIVNCYT